MSFKIYAFLSRKKGLSKEEFHDYWRHPHGAYSRFVEGMATYCQNHQMDLPALDDRQRFYEGIPESRGVDLQATIALLGAPVGDAYINPDAARFVDLDRITAIVVEEHVSAAPPASLEKPDSLWSPDHAAIIFKLLQFSPPDSEALWDDQPIAETAAALGALRYVSCEAVRHSPLGEPRYAKAREYWWPTLSRARAGIEAARDRWPVICPSSSEILSVFVQSEYVRYSRQSPLSQES